MLFRSESSRPDPQHLDYVRRGLAAVEGKKEGWRAFGPPIFRYAVLAARNHNLPEEEEWTARGVELFPDSFYSRIDIAFLAFIRCWENKQYKECIPWGEMYMAAIEDYDAGPPGPPGLRRSPGGPGGPAGEHPPGGVPPVAAEDAHRNGRGLPGGGPACPGGGVPGKGGGADRESGGS